MSAQEEKQVLFIKETIDKVHNDLTKLIIDTNYTNVQSIHLRNELDKIKSKILKEERQLKNKKNFRNLNLDQELLPVLDNIHNPNKFIPNSSLFSHKLKNKNILRGFQDINRVSKTENQKIISPKVKNLNIKTNEYMDKFYKYNNDSKNRKFFHPKIYDEYNNTVIRNKDISLGIYDLNVKKLIPKGADVTLSMNIWGSPMKISGKNVKSTYKKSSSKDEVASGDLNKLSSIQYNKDEFYKTQPLSTGFKMNKNVKNMKNMTTTSFLTNKKGHSSTLFRRTTNYKEYWTDKTTKESIFITDDSTSNLNSTRIKKNVTDNNFGKTVYNINPVSKAFYDTGNKQFNYTYYGKAFNKDFSNNFNSRNLYTFRKTIKKSFYNYIKNISMKDNFLIKYLNYQLVIDEQFNLFKQKNKHNWKKLHNILSNYNILFEKLNINKAMIDSNKILKLLEYYNGNTKNITNKDLLMCLTRTDLLEKGFNPDNEFKIYEKIKEAFIIRIQKMYRKRLAKNKCKKLKLMHKFVVKIQKHIRGYLVRKSVEVEKENYKELIHNQYIELFNQFKENYEEIQSHQRVEIHINSLSYNGDYNDCHIDKYSMKESLQINRLIRLVDPKVEIVYIVPYELPETILSYYYSILENLGVTNLENRVHFIIPEASEFLPLNYSLSKLLYFSYRTLMEIKSLVFGKNCYIIPGIVGEIEEKLSTALNIPMLMSPKNEIDFIFNKSGIKSTFEINDIPFPISAWNIITEEEFYSSLAHLIVSYPKIRIWIFKGNYDTNSTGIAYFNTDKIDIINQLRMEKKTNNDFSPKKYEEKLFFYLPNLLMKNASFAYSNLYKNWKEYLEHFLLNKGIIECCPTKELGGIMGRPCVPLLIEPNGKVKILPTYEKINTDFFKNIICTSPQKCLDNYEMAKLADKIGNYLFSKDIIGYVTVDCITFHDGKRVLYWCVDMKYGFTQTICDIQYCYFLYIQSILQKSVINDEININEVSEEINKNSIYNKDLNNESKDGGNNNKKEEEKENENKKEENSNQKNNNKENKNIDRLLSDSMVFSLPYISSELIKEIKLKDLLREYRFNNIVYNTTKREGIIINFCDGLECGIFGLCGVINLEELDRINPELKLWRLIESSTNIIKKIFHTVKKVKIIPSIVTFNENDQRNDRVEFHYITDTIKKIIKEKEIEQEKEENRRKKLANSPFI